MANDEDKKYPPMVWTEVGSTHIVMHGAGPVPESTFQLYMSEMLANHETIDRAIVYSHGGRFDARQREEFARRTSHRIGLKIAIVSDSAWVRGAGTAAGWISPSRNFEFFSPKDIDKALDYIKVPKKEQLAIKFRIGSLSGRVGETAP